MSNSEAFLTPGSSKFGNEVQSHDPREAVSCWLAVEAKQKLKEALIKIGIEMHQVSGQHLTHYSVKALENEKRRVKNELKVYD